MRHVCGRSQTAQIIGALVLLAVQLSVASPQAPGAPDKEAVATGEGASPPGEAASPSQEAADAYMAMIAPVEEHKRLTALAGVWKTTAKLYMGPGEPTVSVGTATFEPILGGRYVTSKHVGSINGMPFEGFDVTGYDRSKNQYFTVWFDNMGTGMMYLIGHASPDGKMIAYEGTVFDPVKGMDVKVREEVVYESDRRYLFTMYVEEPGPTGTMVEKKAMEMVGERQ